ncbi:type IV toxin-antitoxin system AbiEi family antitoxin [Pedobacter heparinus]|uniref:type IV toxin-antitoxin system AbiEi family antitoxin n=1 Tax=Pedobacter heparinus TaxID=984 RepID=UPI00292FACF4|nr:type IV toxin-antitoxin system AbiEi family antitoxin [Pedobacter heparinus]
MNYEHTIAQQAIDQLEEYTPIKGEWNLVNTPPDDGIDGTIDLAWAGNKVRFFVEVKNELRAYQLPKILKQAEHFKPMMVIAERIFPILKEKLREHKISYLDGAGNIYVEQPGIYLWLEGRKVPEQLRTVTNRAFTKTGLRTVFYLLWKPEAINMPHRKLARLTGVALGNIRNIILGLKQAGFLLQINDQQLALQNKSALLERWMAGYKETLRPFLLIGKYRLNRETDFRDLMNFPIKKGETVWGGEPAAELLNNYLKHKDLTVYTTEARTSLMQQWRLIPDTEGNITFYEKFWQEEQEGPPPLAPALLIYADLMITADPRNMEAAERIYHKFLKQEYEQY